MAVRAIQTHPAKQIVMVDQIASVSAFDEGVAIFDQRKRIIGWFETSNLDHQARICDILLEILENPRRAKKPDFSFMYEAAPAAATSVVTSARAVAPQPQRQNASSSGSASNSSAAS